MIAFYQAQLPDLSEGPGKGPDDVVLAYEKNVPTEGGLVLMLNRSVKKLTADEFKAARKAGNGTAGSTAVSKS